ERRPALEARAILVPEDRDEVVEHPGAVEAERVSLLPGGEEVVPRHVLIRGLDAETDVRRTFVGDGGKRGEQCGEQDERGSHAGPLTRAGRRRQSRRWFQRTGARTSSLRTGSTASSKRTSRPPNL